MGHGEDQSGARQDRTRGRGRTRVVPGRTGPEGMEGKAEGAQESRKLQQLSASVHQRKPKGAGQGSSTEWPSLKQLHQFQSKPASDERVGQGAQVSSSFTSLKQGVGLYIG